MNKLAEESRKMFVCIKCVHLGDCKWQTTRYSAYHRNCAVNQVLVSITGACTQHETVVGRLSDV